MDCNSNSIFLKRYLHGSPKAMSLRLAYYNIRPDHVGHVFGLQVQPYATLYNNVEKCRREKEFRNIIYDIRKKSTRKIGAREKKYSEIRRLAIACIIEIICKKETYSRLYK